MAIEIEHKYLLINDEWRHLVTHSMRYRQGYLTSNSNCSVRVRTGNDKAWLNIKSATIGSSRDEYEYEIPYQDADEMMQRLCKRPLIEKTRHFVPVGKHIWEVDEFEGENEGLIVAEIELSSHEETFVKPSWIGQEVTSDLRYYNNNLAANPYRQWRYK
ncbi:MAG: CYTH domain-containing protein [Methylomicrobium sp.]